MNKFWKNWNAVRTIQLITGIAFGVYATVSKDYLFYWIAGFFLLQAVLNFSLCGAGGCGAGVQQQPKSQYDIKKYEPKKINRYGIKS